MKKRGIQEIRHPVNRRHEDERTRGERVADRVTAAVGSWPFVVTQSIILLCWLLLNGYVMKHGFHLNPWDRYPFILLNLMLSFQAAYTGPIVMLSQNRQSRKDRDLADHDFQINQEALTKILSIEKQNNEILQRLADK